MLRNPNNKNMSIQNFDKESLPKHMSELCLFIIPSSTMVYL